jgi:hypothetical protein
MRVSSTTKTSAHRSITSRDSVRAVATGLVSERELTRLVDDALK